MPIGIEEVEHLAELAKLKLSQTEKKKFARELDQIIQYIDQLKEVDIANIPPTSHVFPMENVLREDKVEPSLSQQQALANAPDKKDGYFRVPKVI